MPNNQDSLSESIIEIDNVSDWHDTKFSGEFFSSDVKFDYESFNYDKNNDTIILSDFQGYHSISDDGYEQLKYMYQDLIEYI